MVRLSKLTDYAVVVLLRIASGQTVQTASGLAAATGIPEPTVAKVLKLLASSGLAASSRGARGGYRLARPVAEISVADVITAIDGPIALTACVDGGFTGCDISGVCAVHGRWSIVNDAIRAALSGITLAELSPAKPVITSFAIAASQPAAHAAD
jgi:FeS assembly SUF system regulator